MTASSTATNASQAPSKAFVFANLVLTHLGWLACVMGAARGWPWSGTIACAAMLAWHLMKVARPFDEALLAACTIAIGMVFDAFLVGSGFMTFPPSPGSGWYGPIWMLALWAIFAMTLNVLLRFLKRRWWLAAAIGAVAGPLSFWSGVRIGAATFAEPLEATLLLALGWAATLPALMWLSDRFDGVTAAPRRAPLGGPAGERA